VEQHVRQGRQNKTEAAQVTADTDLTRSKARSPHFQPQHQSGTRPGSYPGNYHPIHFAQIREHAQTDIVARDTQIQPAICAPQEYPLSAPAKSLTSSTSIPRLASRLVKNIVIFLRLFDPETHRQTNSASQFGRRNRRWAKPAGQTINLGAKYRSSE